MPAHSLTTEGQTILTLDQRKRAGGFRQGWASPMGSIWFHYWPENVEAARARQRIALCGAKQDGRYLMAQTAFDMQCEECRRLLIKERGAPAVSVAQDDVAS